MKILFLTQYFPPETGAPQNRLFQLAKRLQALGAEVSVLTAMPNYPVMKIFDGYRGKFYHYEEMAGLPVHRCWIFSKPGKSIVRRLINYFSFVLTSLVTGLIKTSRQDFVFCESPPLFLGMSAFLLARCKGAGLIFNVSDLWPESAEKLGLVTNPALLRLSTRLEEFLYRKSVMVTGQTQGIVGNISSRFPEKKVRWLRNGVDRAEIGSFSGLYDWRAKAGFKSGDFIVVYAGIIGHAQGLEVIMKAAGRLRDNPAVHFILVGNGPVLKQLQFLRESMTLSNVTFYDNRPKKEVVPILEAADIAVIPLRRLDLFKGAIPSKIYETLALKKPLLLGVEGEARDLFIERGGAGWAFEPENDEDLADRIRYLEEHRGLLQTAGEKGQAFVFSEFDLDAIAKEFHRELEEMMGKRELIRK